jgi:hypothetical protein
VLQESEAHRIIEINRKDGPMTIRKLEAKKRLVVEQKYWITLKIYVRKQGAQS